MISKTIITARYAETDKMGIVHHSRYYPWFEIARSDFIKRAGMSYAKMEEKGILLPLTETRAKYFCGVVYDEEVCVTCRLTKLTVVRCSFEYEVTRVSDGTLMTKGMTSHAFCDKTLKPINIMKKFPEFYELALGLLEEE